MGKCHAEAGEHGQVGVKRDTWEQYEIVGVLIKRATAKNVPSADLRAYRAEWRKAKTAK